MVVEFKDNNCIKGVKDVFIRDGKKLLKIFYGANGDLYFDIFGSHNKEENSLWTATFLINENEEIYKYFEHFFNSIVGCKVFDINEIELELHDFDNSFTNRINSIQKRNENLKMKYAYKKLVHNDAVIWYSDNIYDENANILRIERNCGEIKLCFINNPGDPSFGFSIRICNSGSKYDPFNICFMNLFNQFQFLVKEDSTKKLVRTENRCK